MTHNKLDKLLHPTNKLEQIQGVIEFYLPDNLDVKGKIIPMLLESIALTMFKTGEGTGYRVDVIRNALSDLDKNGMIDYKSPPY